MMQCKDLLKYTYHVTTDSRVQTHSDLGVFLSILLKGLSRSVFLLRLRKA